MKKCTFSKISPVILAQEGAQAALVAGYLASNQKGFFPNTKAIATFLKIPRGAAVRALEKLEKSGYAVRADSGGWRATQKLMDVISADNFTVPTEILKKSDLNVPARLLLGYLMTSKEHGLDDMVDATGMSKTRVNRYLENLQQAGLIQKLMQGGGRGKKRHFSCLCAYSTAVEADSDTVELTGDSEFREECYHIALAQLGTRNERCHPEIYETALEILTELNMAEDDDQIKIGKSTMCAPAVWDFVEYVDGDMIENISERLEGRWERVRYKKEYLFTALLQEADIVSERIKKAQENLHCQSKPTHNPSLKYF